MKVLAKVGLILLVWIIIPSALGFAGYYFVGPNLGKNGWFGNVAQKIAPAAAKAAADNKTPESKPVEPQVDEPSSSKFAEPEVEVTVSKGETRRSRDEEPVRPRKRKPKKVEAPAPVEDTPSNVDPASDAPTKPPSTGGEPPVEDGGSGGAAGDGR
ncbi:MAG: hypothetical protein K1X67_23400 [Fimbriimonadaceae bacterium]|nr:hypothetical protein [Fimbriimonadaceae bacterium]